jgi:hypothetical protein
MLRGSAPVLLHQATHDRIGDRLLVDLVFAATDPLLDLAEIHVARVPFPYRFCLPDHL